ncbi:MAG: cache domain-containing protein [Candidatus Omnitrophica bacterium]|nr:cache domain-containing protein [Candidatus Omnitrophota bacterium]MBU1870016.1 cache domain-containing protein [Candidatus Omnitrophota bacterium]
MKPVKKIFPYLLFAFSLGVVFYFAWLNHKQFEKTMIEQAMERLLMVADSEAQSIEQYFINIDRDLQILSSKYAIRQSIRDENILGRQTSGYRIFLEDSFKDLEGLVDSIYLIDFKGRVVDVGPYNQDLIGRDFSDRPDVKKLLDFQKPFFSDVFITLAGKQGISCLYPIIEEGKFMGLVRAVILVDRINDLVKHINESRYVYAMVMDSNADILSFPLNRFIGRNLKLLMDKAGSDFRFPEFKALLPKILTGSRGSAVLSFFSDEENPKPKLMLMAYAPIKIDRHVWSVTVAREYEAISGPINNNAISAIVFAGLLAVIIIISGLFFYKNQKEKDCLEIAASASRIINKELHLEIDERRHIEEELQDSLRKLKGPRKR